MEKGSEDGDSVALGSMVDVAIRDDVLVEALADVFVMRNHAAASPFVAMDAWDAQAHGDGGRGGGGA